jgi:aldehyde dehydrogenase
MTLYAVPGQPGSLVPVKDRYGNYIGGEFVPPAKGQYFENISPVNGRPFTAVARSTAEDVELALDAAHGAKHAWGRTSPTERAAVLSKIADRIEANLESLAVAERWDNGKPVRETLAADLPLVVDHFRYYAGAIRAQEGSLSEIDADTVAYHFHEPLGVVGQIIPWNFPLLMAAWKLAPRPYSVSLAIFSASASSAKLVTATTGPKISSWKMRMELSPAKMVGVT